MNLFKTILAASALVLAGGAANAVSIDCVNFNPDVTSYVTGTSDCEIDPAIDNDSPDPQFLAGNWFGYGDWQFLAKDDSPVNGVIDSGSGLTITTNGIYDMVADLPFGGDWAISNYDATADYMLVFKSGDMSDPNGLVAYLADGASGSYQSMFFGPQGQTQAVSHISLWKRGGDTPPEVPLPAAGWLLLGGLGGLVAMRRRKS